MRYPKKLKVLDIDGRDTLTSKYLKSNLAE